MTLKVRWPGMEPKNQVLIDIRGLNKYYQVGDTPLHVLKDVDLTIHSGDFVSVMGPSGSGKSTLGLMCWVF